MGPVPPVTRGRRGYAIKCASASRRRSRSRSLRRGGRNKTGSGLLAIKAPAVQPVGVAEMKARAAASRLKLVHISKCAGTALENWGSEHGFSWGKRWPAIGRARKLGLLAPHEERMKTVPWHVPPRCFVHSPYKGFINFTVVRNPYDRVISEFRCPWVGFNAPVRGSLVRKKLRKRATPAQLNRWIREKLSKGVARPPFTNGHWIPQYLYVFKGDGKRVVSKANVVRFEALTDGMAALFRRHGLGDFPCAALTKTNASEMPKFDVGHLDGTTCRLIEQVYAEDFKQFGYKRLQSSAAVGHEFDVVYN